MDQFLADLLQYGEVKVASQEFLTHPLYCFNELSIAFYEAIFPREGGITMHAISEGWLITAAIGSPRT
ncbi:hypothetical protein DFO67_11544 [Modicisalibacter xianhensis]|uniref:Uncharacterized protein n=1 Tax=Modicisalibacter xianhensis TaxID=442341 RepID=A0A4R8FKN4_9GAMM|nr:hypothetical protein DFO67_11544 [Halomonas xianhensis]